MEPDTSRVHIEPLVLTTVLRGGEGGGGGMQVFLSAHCLPENVCGIFQSTVRENLNEGRIL